MTTPVADRLIFLGNNLLKLWRLQGERFYIVPWSNDYYKRLAMVGIKSQDQLKTQPPNQTPKQHLVAIRADRKARAQRQRPRLKKPSSHLTY